MCKKWGYYVRSVCALFCIFCMLFSNTLLVNASDSLSLSNKLIAETSYYLSDSNSEVLEFTGSDIVNNIPRKWLQSWLRQKHTHSIENYNLCLKSDDITIPSNINITHDSKIRINIPSCFVVIKRRGATASSSGGSGISNISINRDDGKAIPFQVYETNNRDYYVLKFSFQDDFICREYMSSTGSTTWKLTIPIKLNFNVDILSENYIDINGYFNYADIGSAASTNFTLNINVNSASDVLVSDSGTQHAVEQGNEIAEDTNTTTHSIFDSISDFFGSFFSNLIGVFVPEDGYFNTWFNRLNTLLENKLGILYFPFSILIDFVNRLDTALSNSSQTGVMKFPAIKFNNLATGETYTFLEEQEVSLYSYNVSFNSSPNSTIVGQTGFQSLFHIIRYMNSILLILGFLSLLRKKLNLIMRGEDNDS